MQVVKRLIRRALRLVLRWPRLRGLIESELRYLARGVAVVEETPAPDERHFVDSYGGRHALDPELRDRLKPSWRTMCDPVAASAVPSDADLAGRARKAVKSAGEAHALVTACVGIPLGGRILEIGCYDGAVSFELARDSTIEMIASDLARYYITQRPDATDTDVDREQRRLAAIRERAAWTASVDVASVAFVEDDITASALEPGSFDAIVSFEVLEHVARPPDAFAAMARLLRPGGVMYHDYNPFFSAIGGHSLATLDVPWGHARFDVEDVERYLREIRPSEADQALKFYRDSLNRMTLVELRAAIDDAGLDVLAIIPWHQRALLADVSPQVLAEVQRNYPSATIDDLLASFVAVVARRPADPT